MCLFPGHTKCVQFSYFNTFLFHFYIYLMSVKSLVRLKSATHLLLSVNHINWFNLGTTDAAPVQMKLSISNLQGQLVKQQHSLDSCWLWTCKAFLLGILCHFPCAMICPFSLKYVFQSSAFAPHRKISSSSGMYPPASSCTWNCIWVVLLLCFIKEANNSIYATFSCAESRCDLKWRNPAASLVFWVMLQRLLLGNVTLSQCFVHF